MPNIVKNTLFLLFFCSFAGGVFYVSTSPNFLHFSEKVFLGKVEKKVSTITGKLSIELEDAGDEEIRWQKATPQSADLTAPVCTASYDPTAWTSGSVVVTLTCSEEVEFCTMEDYSDCPQPWPLPAESGVPCWRAEDIAYNGFTIMACNLGATEVGNGEASYGNYYQWGNNHPMGDGKLTGEYLPNSTGKIDASAFWPNNPFSGATFIKQAQWDSSNNKNLRWGTGDTTTKNGSGTREDRQGPCPTGYHIPSILERNVLLRDVSESAEGIDILENTLFFPYVGIRYSSDATLLNGEGYFFWSYWSSSPYSNTSSAYDMSFASPPYYYIDARASHGDRGNGEIIRCFKNEYNPPAATPCAGAPDITHNGITIMACNLGATEVYNGNNQESYGNYYQRGNNYPMWDAFVATYTPNNKTRVNASAYWPGNPYSSATFVKYGYWDSSNNRNLRWGSGDTTTSNGVGTWWDRQGPCPDGYHIPSALERSQLLSGVENRLILRKFALPLAGRRLYSNATLQRLETNGYYWTSSSYSTQNYSYRVSFGEASKSITRSSAYRGYGASIRCFRNS